MSERKATDVLLDVEAKVNALLSLMKSYDFNLKLLSNKVNSLIELIENKSSPKIKNLEESSGEPDVDFQLTIADPQKENRRVSRDQEIIQPKIIKSPSKESEVIVNIPTQQKPIKREVVENPIPVMQRVISENKKSVFLAEVVIFNSKEEIIEKRKTNGAGKWMYSLPPGDYTIIIRKLESLTKKRLELTQKIKIDGLTSTVELPTVILK